MKRVIHFLAIISAFLFSPACRDYELPTGAGGGHPCSTSELNSDIVGALCAEGTGWSYVSTKVKVPQPFDYSRINDTAYRRSICQGYGSFVYYLCD